MQSLILFKYTVKPTIIINSDTNRKYLFDVSLYVGLVSFGMSNNSNILMFTIIAKVASNNKI